MRIFNFLLCLCLLYSQTSSKPAGPFGSFLQTNLIGLPLIHEKQSWVFDPGFSLRMRPDFVERHGDKGNKLIVRLGTGNDRNETST